MRLFKIVLIILLLTNNLHATENGWSGKVQFGFSFTDGNSETNSLKSELGLTYKYELWKHSIALEGLRAKSSGEKIANRYGVSTTNYYKLSDKSGWAFVSRYEEDDFNGFEHQASASIGYIYVFLDNGTHRLKGALGPGVKNQKEIGTNEETFFIGLGKLHYTWKITENTTFDNNLFIEAGDVNNFIDNKLSLTVAMSKSTALRFAVNVRHNTDVSEGIDKTDTESNVSIVYKF